MLDALLSSPKGSCHSASERVKHSLVGQSASKVFLDVCVHHWPEMVVFTVPEQVYDEHLRKTNREKRGGVGVNRIY